MISLPHGVMTALLCMSLVACGADTGDSGLSNYPSLDSGMALDTGAGPIGSDATTEGVETWARLQVMAGIADLPAFGPKLTETIGLIRAIIRETPDGLFSQEETCLIEIRRPEVPEVTTIIPTAFISSIPIVDRPVLLDNDRVVFARLVEIHGAHLMNRDLDQLPQDADDPRVFDQDQDGKPGLTVQIGGLLDGEVQLVQRVRTRLVGTRDGDSLSGLLEWSGEEAVLGASNALLESPITVEVHRDPNLSYFEARRVDAETTCTDIISQAATLFMN